MLATRGLVEAAEMSQEAVRLAVNAGKLKGYEKVGHPDRPLILVPARYADPEVYRAAVGPRGRPRKAPKES